MLARLDAAQASRPTAGGAAAPMLDEMSKRAQERLLLAQVGREIQANLRHMEQVLDAFFRDNAQARRARVAGQGQPADPRRVADARASTTPIGCSALCQEQIAAYADPETPVSATRISNCSPSRCPGLGFYIEAVEQQRPDRDRLIAPLLAQAPGRGAGASRRRRAADSVEAAVVEALRATLPRLVDEVHRAPADAAAREALKTKLTGPARRRRADRRRRAGGAGRRPRWRSSRPAARRAGGRGRRRWPRPAAPAPEISAETQRLLATDATALDGELRRDLPGRGRRGARRHRRAPCGADAATRAIARRCATMRRGFHTLKGSGRMVGLMDLGEIAYDVEKIHNRLLEEERPVTRGGAADDRDGRARLPAMGRRAVQRPGRVLADPGGAARGDSRRRVRTPRRTRVGAEASGARDPGCRSGRARAAGAAAGGASAREARHDRRSRRSPRARAGPVAGDRVCARRPRAGQVRTGSRAARNLRTAGARKRRRRCGGHPGHGLRQRRVGCRDRVRSRGSNPQRNLVWKSERLEAERLEAERLEAERLEAERLEAERLEAERLEAERLEAERLEAERLEASDSKRSDSKRSDSKRSDSKRSDSKRSGSKRSGSKRSDSKRSDSKPSDSKPSGSKRNGSRQSGSKRNGSKRNGSKRNGSKRNGSKRNGSKRSGSKRNGSKRNGSKRNGSKRNGSKRNGSKRSGSKPSGSKRSGSKPSASKPSDSKPSDSKPSDSKRNGSKRNGSKRSGSKRNGSKRNGSKRNGSKRNGSKRSGSKRSDSKRSALEAERLEAERLEAERLEAERLEAERLEAERLEAAEATLEAERLEAERLEAERLEAERVEAERLEAERLEAERLEAERLEAPSGSKRNDSKPSDSKPSDSKRSDSKRNDSKRNDSKRNDSKRNGSKRNGSKRNGPPRQPPSLRVGRGHRRRRDAVGDAVRRSCWTRPTSISPRCRTDWPCCSSIRSRLPSQEMVRASHTLCGIHRTGGFPLVASLAKALEQCLLDAAAPRVAACARQCSRCSHVRCRTSTRWSHASSRGLRFEANDQTRSAEVGSSSRGCTGCGHRLAVTTPRRMPRRWPIATSPTRTSMRARLQRRSRPRPAREAPSQRTSRRSDARRNRGDGGADAGPQRVGVADRRRSRSGPGGRAGRPARRRSDDVDAAGAADLPRGGGASSSRGPASALRAWRRDPRDRAARRRAAADAAHVQGQRADGRRDATGPAHASMESRLLAGDALATGTPALFDALETDLDNVAFVLDALRAGRYNVELPGCTRRRRSAAAAGASRGLSTPALPRRSVARPRRNRSSPAAEEPAVGAVPRCRGTAAAPEVDAAVETDARQRALLRVRADIIDRLVNEAGEVSIARARVEGELRSLKANLLELTNSVIRLRARSARDRDPGRVADPVADVAGRRARGGLRPARVRPLHALPGADALARRGRQRRVDGPAVAAAATSTMPMPRWSRRRGCRATCSSSCSRSARCPFGSLSDRLYRILRAAGEGARQARQPRDPRRAGRARPRGAGKARRAARAPAAQCARPRHRAARARGTPPASRRPARSR